MTAVTIKVITRALASLLGVIAELLGMVARSARRALSRTAKKMRTQRVVAQSRKISKEETA